MSVRSKAPESDLSFGACNQITRVYSVKPTASRKIRETKGLCIHEFYNYTYDTLVGNKFLTPEKSHVLQYRSRKDGFTRSYGLPKLKRTRMTICVYNARTPALKALIRDLMMQARKTKYKIIGLNGQDHGTPLNAVYETEGELFLGTCDIRGVGAFVNK
ncbi:hypothetical protein RB195_019636 [Necator americanus]|uniref:Uncharacterized protein n=1 Tax=Necator americanus TaxID=51031 RepID=A0ABR1CFW2_NECAM